MTQLQGAVTPALPVVNHARRRTNSIVPAVPYIPIGVHAPRPTPSHPQPQHASHAPEPPVPQPDPIQGARALPWYSVPNEPFPPRPRRRKRLAQRIQEDAPPPQPTVVQSSAPSLAETVTPRTSNAPSEASSTHPTTPSSTAPPSITTSTVHAKSAPALPSSPATSATQTSKPEAQGTAEGNKESHSHPQSAGPEDHPNGTALTTAEPPTEQEPAPAAPTPVPRPKPTSWADILRNKDPKTPEDVTSAPRATASNSGVYSSLEEALKAFHITHGDVISTPFLEPRGLINTGNMCFMNAILQMLVFCGPFYHFLQQVSTSTKNFKDDTPLIETMIMFMHEFRALATNPNAHLKSEDLEKLGEPFIPEYIYETIRKLKRFSHMRRGHQQDAEEFLGFLLDGLHEEAIETMQKGAAKDAAVSDTDHVSGDGGGGWMEVGHKQKAAATRTTEIAESPITKIFGGKLRSELRVPGLTTSVTLEPYTPLQLDIQAPEVKSVVDALKHLTKPERLQGNFNSVKGPDVTATKQVFVDTLPPVLILHLKRFQYDNTGGTQKIWKEIAYPLELHIPSKAMAPMRRHGQQPKYRLIGVIYHHGTSASGGHYTADILRQDAKSWIRLDDTVIKRISSLEVAVEVSDIHTGESNDHDGRANGWEHVNGSGNSNPSSKADYRKSGNKDNRVAYILFYQRI